jgi:hypothetical protein
MFVSLFAEVGVNLLKEYMVKYEFSAQQGLSATDFKYIRVGFTTKKKQGILLQLQDATNSEYISLEVNNAGECSTTLSYQQHLLEHLFYTVQCVFSKVVHFFLEFYGLIERIWQNYCRRKYKSVHEDCNTRNLKKIYFIMPPYRMIWGI